MQNLRRNAKNFAYNFTDAQKAIRETTSNSPWGPTSNQMIIIADLMRNPVAFDEIMGIIWKRLNDSGKNWRHVFKSLCVLDFLIKAGNERVVVLCRSNLYAIETLRDFQHVEEGRDQGLHIRDKAKQLVTQLANGPRASETNGSNSDAIRSQPCGEPVRRPANASEEEEQLRLVMELSLRDQRKTDNLDDEYEVRLQQALEESKKEAEQVKNKLAQQTSFELPVKPKSNVDDLLSLGDLNMNTQPSSSLAWYNSGLDDPWAAQPQAPVSPVPQSIPPLIPGLDNDPWALSQANIQYTAYSTYDMGSIAPPSESQYGNNRLHSYADPFSTNPYDSLVDYEKQNNANQVQNSSKAFLGINQNGVNVDNLVQLNNINNSNPFLQSNQDMRRTPTLNELRAQQQSYPTPSISPFPSSLPPSQMPPISSNNPFASAF